MLQTFIDSRVLLWKIYGDRPDLEFRAGKIRQLNRNCKVELKGSMGLPITQSCSVSNVLFTGGSGVSDFSV